MFGLNLRGFVKLQKKKKIREKLGSDWVGQAPTRIFFFGGGECCVLLCFLFCVVFMFPIFSKKKYKNWILRWVGGVWTIRGFLSFFYFFTLKRPLSKYG